MIPTQDMLNPRYRPAIPSVFIVFL
eukprot:Gb_22060 [translate_table: standard]